jgi:hypothetical protein
MKKYIPYILIPVLALAACSRWPEAMPSKQVASVTLDSHSCSVRVGETWPLRVSFAPAGSSSIVIWASSDESVATVSSTGTVTGVSEGKVRILVVAERNEDASDACEVTVLPPKAPDILVSSIKFSESSFELEKGKILDLTPYVTVLPDNATNPVLLWSGSNNTVALVSGGRVTALSAGTVTVKAAATDGSGVYASCAVKVIDTGSGGPPDPGEDPPADPDLVMFDSCDNLDFFTGNPKHRTGVTVEKLGRQEGSGYIQRVSGTDAEIFVFGRGANVVDAQVTDYSKAKLVFWFYIEDAALLRAKAGPGGRIEISHSGAPSLQALYWDSKERIAEKVANGWNYIVLPFSEAKEVTPDNPFNPKGANYFRIYFNGAAASTEMTYGIDAIGFKQDK